MNTGEDGRSAPPLVPAIAYDDAPAAIRWLTDLLGLRLVRKFETPDDVRLTLENARR